MAAFTDTAENKIIDWMLRGQAIGLANATAAAGTGFSNVYVGLFSVAPTDSTAGTELAGSNYARVAVPCTLANFAGTQAPGSTTASSGTSGTTSNNNVITFPTASADWLPAVSFGIFDSLTAGTLIAYTSMTSKTVQASGSASFAAGTLQFQLDN